MQRELLCLKELLLFDGLDKNDFYSICPGTINKTLLKGQYLFHQGEHDHAVYLIKSGKLKLIQNTEEGREIIINIIGPGEVLGETALFQEQELTFSAVAIEDVRLCAMNRGDLETVIQRNPEFAVKIISHLARKLNATMRQVGETSGASVKEKLLRLLLRLANEYGKTTPEMTVIELKLTQQEMGNMIGASRVKVSQVLRELKAAGILDYNGKYYILKTDFCAKNADV